MSAVPSVPLVDARGAPRARSELAMLDVLDVQWDRLLAALGAGVPSAEAVKGAGLAPETVEAMLRASPERLAQWDDARYAAARRDWPMEVIEDVIESIAEGSVSLKEACALHGKKPTDFMKLVHRDKNLAKMYDTALKTRAMLMTADIEQIADDDGNDLDLTGKGNVAAVQRSKLRVEARRWLVGAYDRDRFGEGAKSQINVGVQINYAERLEEARQRRSGKVAIVSPVIQARLDGNTVDAEIVEERAAWDDV